MSKFRKHSIEEKRKRSKLRRKRKKAAKKESGNRNQSFTSKKRTDLKGDRMQFSEKTTGRSDHKEVDKSRVFNQGGIIKAVEQVPFQKLSTTELWATCWDNPVVSVHVHALKKNPKVGSLCDSLAIVTIFLCLLNCFRRSEKLC